MAQPRLDLLGVSPLRDKQAHAGMPQVVEPQRLEAGPSNRGQPVDFPEGAASERVACPGGEYVGTLRGSCEVLCEDVDQEAGIVSIRLPALLLISGR